MKDLFKVKLTTKAMTFMAMFAALQIILEVAFNVIPGQPQGGNISMDLLPIIFVSYFMGAGYGLIVGVISVCLQFALGLAKFYGPWSVLLDYLIPVVIVGLSSIFKNVKFKNYTIYTGIIITMIIKFISHYLSGAWLFAEYAPEGVSSWLYSLGYNLPYCLPTLILCYIGFVVLYPRLKKALKF